jgi:hypothetical protein
VADTIAREERRGFLARLAAFDFEAKRLEVERRTLPPGLGHSSVCGVIHFDAKGTALDDAVVLFSCGPFVGSADLIGRRGAVDLEDSLQIASLMADDKVGEACA